MSKNKCQFVTIQLFIFTLFASILIQQPAQAQLINNMEVRVEGLNVFDRVPADSVFVRVEPGVPFTITWRLSVDENVSAATLGFKLYSPDGSITSIAWDSPPAVIGEWASPSTFSLIPVSVTLGPDGFDGTLPSTFMTGGINLFGTGYGPTDYQDIMTATLTVSEEGLLCFDSAFSPPSASWMMTPNGGPQWGATVGGYPDGGFCIEVFKCKDCTVAGDANNDGITNIADMVYMIDFIFHGGPGFPCFLQADADGNTLFSVSDVLYMIQWMFFGGPAVVCAQ